MAENVFQKGARVTRGMFLQPKKKEKPIDEEVAAFNKLAPDDVGRLMQQQGAKAINELITRVERKRSRRQDV